MLKIGITGGIGSGKSTICKFFEIIGIPVFTADLEARAIMDNSSAIRNQLSAVFGKDIYLPNHTLDRNKLARLIFGSPGLLEEVNAIVHPEVRKCFLDWVQKQNAAYVVYEAAILFETGFYTLMDFNILITAPEEERIKRVMASREKATVEDIRSRMSRQWPDEEKIKLADHVLNNNNEELIIPQLVELDKRFRTHG
jgi:dephospho-CoA kinase